MGASEDARLKQADYLAEWKQKRAGKANDIYEQFKSHIELGPSDPERRASCRDSYLKFGKTYFPEMFYLPFAPDHFEEEALLIDAIKHGAWFAFAEPRGTGKTTRSRIALIWAVVYGHVDYAVYIGATQKSASRAQESILKAFVNNPILREDFPEVCLPFVMCKGKAQKAVHQQYKGEPSYVVCSADRIATAYMPDIEYSELQGQGLIDFTSIGGEIRGRSFDLPDGRSIRPKVAVADDPQTRDVAKSPSESQNVIDILTSDVAYMAGPKDKMGLLIPCTIIEGGDAADRMLDRELNPKFHGKRVSWFESMPSHMPIWEQYREVVIETQLADMPETESNDVLIKFYSDNRELCDKGAKVFWEDAFNESEFGSATHKGMHLWLEDEAAFMAEYQNRPLDAKQEGNLQLNGRDVMARVNGYDKGVIPEGYDIVTSFVDVQHTSLWYATCAFKKDMTCAVIDYGVFPDQAQNYVTLRGIKTTMCDLFEQEYHAACLASLEAVTKGLVQTSWKNPSGHDVALQAIGIDSNYHMSTDAVYAICRMPEYKALVLPTVGVGTTARKPNLWMPGTARKKGERRGHNWRIIRSLDTPRILQIATNSWKTIVATSWALDIDEPGSGTVFGPRKGKPWASHQAFGENMSSEQSFNQSVEGSTLSMWELEKAHTDNHWFDCVVGCYVQANMLGAERPGMKKRPNRHAPGSRRKVSKTLAQRLEDKRNNAKEDPISHRNKVG